MLLKKKTYIIAEAGINHKGNFKIAKKFILAAKRCGADAIKFQSYISEEVVKKKIKLKKYQKIKKKNKKIKMINLIKKYELDQSKQKKLFYFAKKNKIDFLSSAFDLYSLDFLIKVLKLKILKIPSGEITNFPYLKKIAKTKKNVILSTGMSNFLEIENALKVLTSYGLKKNKIILLHCNTAYPTPFKNVNLNVLKKIKNKFKTDIGYSDHTLGIEVSIAAAALGARVIEKHFTLNKTWDGPDQKASLDTKELETMIKSIRNIDIAKGNSTKVITTSEKQNVFFARKSIVAKTDIVKGERFSQKNLTVKRPGNGISPMRWNYVIHKKSKFNFKKDDQIKE